MEGADHSISRQRCNKGNEFNNKSVRPVVDHLITKPQVSEPNLNINHVTTPHTSIKRSDHSSSRQRCTKGHEFNDKSEKNSCR